MSQIVKKKAIPYEIFVVETEEGFKIYCSEGQAIRQTLQLKARHQYAQIHIYRSTKVEQTNE